MGKVNTFTVSASTAGNSHSSVWVPDRHLNPFNVGFGAVIATTAHYTVQHTFQDPLQTSAGALTWYPHSYVANASANTDGNYGFPIGGVRVEISAASEGGVTVNFVQAGIGT